MHCNLARIVDLVKCTFQTSDRECLHRLRFPASRDYAARLVQP